MLDGVLQCLALALYAAFHLPAQFLIHFKVLNLQLAISLLLSVDELTGHVELNLRVIRVFLCILRYDRIWALISQVCNAFVQLLVNARLSLLPAFRVIRKLSRLRNRDLVVLQRGLAEVHGRGGTNHLVAIHKNVFRPDLLQLTLLPRHA